MHSTRSFFRVLRRQLNVKLALALLAASSQLGQVAFASGAAAVMPSFTQDRSVAAACNERAGNLPIQGCEGSAKAVDDSPRLSLPAGTSQCPESGPSVSCNVVSPVALPTPGTASLPTGSIQCPLAPGKQAPSTPAACNETVLAAPMVAEPAGRIATSAFLPLPVTPSVPSWTLVAAIPQQRIRLTSNVDALKPGEKAVLTATTAASVTGTPLAIEIFDQTTGTLVGACMQASQCVVAYAARSGVHTFAAYVTPPVAHQPTENVVTSNPLTVAWFDVALATSSSIVGPGKSVTFTATTTADLGSTNYQLSLYDKTSAGLLTYCSRGTTCSTTLTKDQAGRRSIVAYVAEAAASLPPPSVQAQSAPVTAIWMGVKLDANTTHPQKGSVVFMRATSNVNVTNTPWSIGIYDEQGNLVSEPCKSGTTCTARVNITSGSTPWFTAVIGAARVLVRDAAAPLAQLVRTAQARGSLTDIQARSAPMKPTRLLWGVDSCKPFTSDPTAAAGLYNQVRRAYGTPDFWARYMTRTYNCPGISQAEIAAAAYKKMGLLPIYNDYDCNAVRTYNVGLRYATEASAAATSLGIPLGTVLAIDIEPYGEQCPGAARVDAGFIEGWYDGVTQANYAPLYYGDGTVGSDFANAWCRAVSERPETAANSYLWTFQPSLTGRFTKAKAPQYSPHEPNCEGNVAAWQYVLSTGARPDVDSDEAISSLPLWFPGGGQG